MEARVSVIVPVHNGELYIGETLASILNQTVQPHEVLVVDDASSDNSSKIAESFGGRVRCIKLEHVGAAAARNHGVDEAKGDFVSFLDADDLWLSQKTEKQLEVLLKSEKPTAVFCHMEQFISPEIHDMTIQERDRVLPGFSSCTMLISRRDFLRVGYFSQEVRSGEFIEWFARANDEKINHHMLTDVLARRRVHRHNQGFGDSARRDYLRIAKTLIERKRAK